MYKFIKNQNINKRIDDTDNKNDITLDFGKGASSSNLYQDFRVIVRKGSILEVLKDE